MCTPSNTFVAMLIETMSVRETREQLPRVLERFRQGDRTMRRIRGPGRRFGPAKG